MADETVSQVVMEKVLQKYFKDDKTMYFHSSDAHHNIEGDTYLRYYSDHRPKPEVQLWIGGENGEVCIKVTNNPEELETLIRTIIY